jgi:hypothetical protein
MHPVLMPVIFSFYLGDLAMFRLIPMAAISLISVQAFAVSPIMKDSLKGAATKLGKQRNFSLKRISACADLSGAWRGTCRGTINDKAVEFPMYHDIKQSGCDTVQIGDRTIDVGQSETSAVTFLNQPGMIGGSTIEFTAWMPDGQTLYTDLIAAFIFSGAQSAGTGLTRVNGKESWELKDGALIHWTSLKNFAEVECTLTK